ncbi:hypothetical protein Phi13:1_gp049 [Cellulophaga phage phi13:1]|uniref:Uncharacterized protein n=1 Tax=Cellulophaga phage phi13:1 TaxID=1327992 RepID=S0A2P7_9CAUD|nr:hypothetical protein Phi13:1_gp049 [Cellulophaga phage phi13:1]
MSQYFKGKSYIFKKESDESIVAYNMKNHQIETRSRSLNLFAKNIKDGTLLRISKPEFLDFSQANYSFEGPKDYVEDNQQKESSHHKETFVAKNRLVIFMGGNEIVGYSQRDKEDILPFLFSKEVKQYGFYLLDKKGTSIGYFAPSILKDLSYVIADLEY